MEIESGSDCEVQIRYQSDPIKAKIFKTSKGNRIDFCEPISAVTPGQSAVIYQKDECLGGAVIKERISKKYYSWADNRGYNYEVYE
jgi:tRNA U34 2-thiouridine synthase MnmA/TrmU